MYVQRWWDKCRAILIIYCQMLWDSFEKLITGPEHELEPRAKSIQCFMIVLVFDLCLIPSVHDSVRGYMRNDGVWKWEWDIYRSIPFPRSVLHNTKCVSDDVWSSTDLPDDFLFPWAALRSIGPDIKSPRHICLGEYMCGSLFHSLPPCLSLPFFLYHRCYVKISDDENMSSTQWQQVNLDRIHAEIVSMAEEVPL